MPYISEIYRRDLEPEIKALIKKINEVSSGDHQNTGILNYIFTRLLIEILKLPKDPAYYMYNSAIGILECCKLEFYRRFVASYEDTKIKENGDVI